MRHSAKDFCPVCEWAIGHKLARIDDPFHVDTRATIPGAWTVLGFYHEEPTPPEFGADLSRLVLYAGATGDFQIHRAPGTSAPLSAANARIDAFWTSLSTCEIAGVPHLLAHSLPLRRLGIYQAVMVGATRRLDLVFDSGVNAVPWTHVTTFVSGGVPHMLAYNTGNGRIEISRIEKNSEAPKIVSGTALDPTNLFLPGFTIITTFTVDGVPHVLKHNANDGAVHVQSLDPPGRGPNTFISKAGHWTPGASVAVGYESEGRTFVHRMSLGNYEALDWVWPGGAGVEMQLRRQSLDITLGCVMLRGRTQTGTQPFSAHQVVALDVVGGGVRFMSVH
jgi:hypothetical protein